MAHQFDSVLLRVVLLEKSGKKLVSFLFLCYIYVNFFAKVNYIARNIWLLVFILKILLGLVLKKTHLPPLNLCLFICLNEEPLNRRNLFLNIFVIFIILI